MRRVVALIVMLVALPSAELAVDAIPGPINARVVSVYDGDTLTVDAEPLPSRPVLCAARWASACR